MSIEYTDVQLDALRELANIGSGKASTALSMLLGRAVDISVPKAHALSFFGGKKKSHRRLMELWSRAPNVHVVPYDRFDPLPYMTAADLMISDWSGAALEYAFGIERPVLFLDVARKINNPRYVDLGIEPIEARMREQIGAVDGYLFKPFDMQELIDCVARCLRSA